MGLGGIARAGAVVLIALLVAACGRVVFVDPNAAARAGLKIISAQRLTVAGDPRDYFHVRIGTRARMDQIRLRAEGPPGSFELPLDGQDAQFCGDRDLCISVTLGPGMPREGLDSLALEAPEIAALDRAPLGETVKLEGYHLRGDAKTRNTAVQVTIDDPIRRYFAAPVPARVLASDGVPISQRTVLLFSRSFEVQTTPGPCTAAASGDDPGWTRQDGNPFTTPAAFSAGADSQTCVSVRPALPERGPAVGAAGVGGRALITRFQHVYTPIVEKSPLVFVLMFDLELAAPARCSAAQDLVRSAVLEAAAEIATAQSGGAEVMALPAIQIANANGMLCKQSNTRSFDGVATGSAIKESLSAAFGPERRIRVIEIYASNLNLELPATLEASVRNLRHELTGAGPMGRDLLIAISAELPLRALTPDRAIPWLATEEPAFRAEIKRLLAEIWPFKTMVHTDRTVVPMLAEAERPRFSAFRICRASHMIAPIGSRRGPMAYDVEATGPAYTVALGPQVLLEARAFSVPSVVVEWQGCEALCDRPSPEGDPRTSWDLQAACD